MRLLFGEFAPDAPPSLNSALQVCSGVYPSTINAKTGETGYRPAKQFSGTHTALAAACKGASAFVVPASGFGLILAGSVSKLYRAFAGGWAEIGSGYNLTGGDRWRFAQFGGLAIATNGVDPVVAYDMTTSTLAPLGGSPPIMKLLGVVKDFLVGGVIDSDVMRLQWSGINKADWWTPAQRQSDYQVLPDGGEVNGILGGEFGLILQRNCVRRMDYVGGNVIFKIDKISTNVGCISMHSVVQWGELGFWRSDQGFVMWDGEKLRLIGDERVDRYFDGLYTKSSWANASTAIDARNKLVIWSMGDQMFVYHWGLDRWAILPQAAEIVFGGVNPGISLDELDAIYGNLDAVSIAPDDASLAGGDPRFYVFNTSHAMGTLTGANMAASWAFGDLELNEGRDTRLNRARPITDAVAGLTLTLGARPRLGDSASSTAYTTLTSGGDMPIRERGRYLRPTLAIAAATTWTFAQGLNVQGARGTVQ